MTTQESPKVVIRPEVVPDVAARNSMRKALSSLLSYIPRGPWDLRLEPSEIKEGPRLWILSLARPGHIAIAPVRAERQNVRGVVRTALECVAAPRETRRAS
jgi:hypothetical protein